MNCGKPPTSLAVGEVGFIKFDIKDLVVPDIDWRSYGYNMVITDEMMKCGLGTEWKNYCKKINDDILAASSYVVPTALELTTHHHDPDDDGTVTRCPYCGHEDTTGLLRKP